MRVLVNVNKVTLDEKDKLNAGEYNIHEVEFEFSEEYNGLIKKATFSTKEHAYLVEITNSSVIIPYEVLEETGDFEIGAFGYDTDGDELILRYSPSPTYVHVDLGSYRDNFDNYKVPTADVVEQLTKRIEDAEETVQGYDGRLTATETKLETIETGAEVNIIEDVKVNGTSLTIENKSVNVPVPTKTSDLNNDSGYITKDVNDLTNYTTTTDMNTAINNTVNGEKELRQQADTNLQNQIDAITSSTDVVDVVGTYQELQDYDTSKLTNNDVIKVLQDNTHNNAISYYRWIINGTGSWNYIGSEGPFYTKGETDTLLNTKQNTIDASHKLNADYVDDTSTTNKFTSTSEKSTWNAKYDKPSGGIPKTDLSSDVQTSLGKADTAIQDVSDKEDKSNKVTSVSSSSTDTQYPSAKLLYDKLTDLNNQLYTDKEVSSLNVETTTLNNTTQAPLKTTLKGNTSQDSTTGKNKFDGVFRQGSASETTSAGVIFNQNNFLLQAGTYTFSNDLTSSFNYAIFGNTNEYPTSNENTYNSGWKSGNLTFTISQDLYFGILIKKTSGNIAPSDVSSYKMQLESGNQATSWEQYSGGIASPNPTYPQPINVVSGDNEIKVCGDNLLNIQALVKGRIDSGVLGYAYATSNLTLNDDSFSFTTTEGYRGVATDFMLVEELTDYVLSYISTDTLQRLCDCYDSNKNWLGRVWFEDISIDNQKITTLANTKYVRVSWQLNNTGTGTITSPIFKKSSVAIEYIRYKGQTYPISLGTLELCKIGTYQDYFYKDSGKWYLHKEIGKVVLNGSEYGWAKTNYTFANENIFTGKPLSLCSHFTNAGDVWVSSNEAYRGKYTLTNVVNTFKCMPLTDMTKSDFTTWLGNNNVSVYYNLSTAIEIEITDNTLITQLDNILNAISYEEQTNVSQENNDKSFIIDIIAFKNTIAGKIAGLQYENELLKEKIDELEE